MTTTTKKFDIDHSGWTEIALGKANVSIVNPSNFRAKIHVGQEEPAADTPDYLTLPPGAGPAISLNGLSGTDAVYARAFDPEAGSVIVIAGGT